MRLSVAWLDFWNISLVDIWCVFQQATSFNRWDKLFTCRIWMIEQVISAYTNETVRWNHLLLILQFTYFLALVYVRIGSSKFSTSKFKYQNHENVTDAFVIIIPIEICTFTRTEKNNRPPDSNPLRWSGGPNIGTLSYWRMSAKCVMTNYNHLPYITYWWNSIERNCNNWI